MSNTKLIFFIVDISALNDYIIYTNNKTKGNVMKIPQIKPDWNTGIYIGNGVVAKPKTTKPVSNNEADFKKALKEWALKQKKNK